MKSHRRRIQISVSNFLFQLHDHVHGHVEDAELRLRLLSIGLAQRLEGHTDAAEFGECVVDVPDAHPLPRVVRYASVFFFLDTNNGVGDVVRVRLFPLTPTCTCAGGLSSAGLSLGVFAIG